MFGNHHISFKIHNIYENDSTINYYIATHAPSPLLLPHLLIFMCPVEVCYSFISFSPYLVTITILPLSYLILQTHYVVT